jgi:CDP-diacylglycerol--glycerol-3-phosphate 3-phosphatidyltransferase
VQFQRVAAWVAILIIAREVAVTGVRAIAAAEGFSLPVETLGKYKMTAQVIAIILLILDGVTPSSWNLNLIGTAVLYTALVLGLTSGGRHMVNFWQEITLRRPS